LPKPVYLIVYLEALDDFVGADVRDLVDIAEALSFFGSCEARGETLTLHTPRDATLERAFRRRSLDRVIFGAGRRRLTFSGHAIRERSRSLRLFFCGYRRV
jgi:hypothetical protein